MLGPSIEIDCDRCNDVRLFLCYHSIPYFPVLDHCALKPCKNAGEECTLVDDYYECSYPQGMVLDGKKCVKGK